MDNSNSSNNTEKKNKNFKNAILIISIIYFLFVLEESQEANRKRFYKLLILISSIFLILTNFELIKEIIFNYIWLPIKYKFTKSADKESRDDTRKVLEYLFTFLIKIFYQKKI